MELYKYPHTPYLPWSPSIDANDPVIDTIWFMGKEVVVTIKMDGENITMYPDAIHARSLDDDGHVSKDWVKNFWAQRRHYIPKGMRICGECLYIKHSIEYNDLPAYFMGFSVWEDNLCLDWKRTLTIFDDCGIISVPVIFEGNYNERVLHTYTATVDFSKQEGYVIRVAEPFWLNEFEHSIAKYVRPGHVQTNAVHWKYTTLTKNRLVGQARN